jgi:hypothetical protein
MSGKIKLSGRIVKSSGSVRRTSVESDRTKTTFDPRILPEFRREGQKIPLV